MKDDTEKNISDTYFFTKENVNLHKPSTDLKHYILRILYSILEHM